MGGCPIVLFEKPFLFISRKYDQSLNLRPALENSLDEMLTKRASAAGNEYRLSVDIHDEVSLGSQMSRNRVPAFIFSGMRSFV